MEIANLYQQFVTERKFLKNVSPKTLEWYEYSFRAFRPHLGQDFASGEALKPALKAAVMALAASNLQPSSVNDYIRAVNAFLRWCADERHIPDLIKIPYLKEEQKVIPAFTSQHVQRLLAWKPQTFTEHRLYALMCLLLDTGARIYEALALLKADADFDNLVVKVKGKGGKHRLVPMSLELRKALFASSAGTNTNWPSPRSRATAASSGMSCGTSIGWPNTSRLPASASRRTPSGTRSL